MSSGPLNWFSQVASVTWFSLRTLPERKGSAVTTAVGIAGVTAVFVGVLSISTGLRKTLSSSAREDVALVTRQGADTELTSILLRDDVRVVSDTPGVARTSDGPLVSAELFVIIDLPKRGTGTDANVPFRGVEMTAFDVRGDVEIIEGRRFEPGRNEIIVGAAAAREFAGLEVGRTLRISGNDWDIVGAFTAGGGAAESEIWTDAVVIQGAYQRGTSFQSVQVRLTSADAFQEFRDALTSNPQVEVSVARQSEFYARQSENTTTFISGIGVFIALMMSLGALFGALNTMYNAVAVRIREIATLRALGFGSGPVILSVMVESLVLAMVGGGFGAGAAYLAFDGFTAATLNFQTFSQIAFAFRVTPQLLLNAIMLAVLIGAVGGFFPAIRAARLPIATALRET